MGFCFGSKKLNKVVAYKEVIDVSFGTPTLSLFLNPYNA